MWREESAHADTCEGKSLPILTHVKGRVCPYWHMWREESAHTDTCEGKSLPILTHVKGRVCPYWHMWREESNWLPYWHTSREEPGSQCWCTSRVYFGAHQGKQVPIYNGHIQGRVPIWAHIKGSKCLHLRTSREASAYTCAHQGKQVPILVHIKGRVCLYGRTSRETSARTCAHQRRWARNTPSTSMSSPHTIHIPLTEVEAPEGGPCITQECGSIAMLGRLQGIPLEPNIPRE